MMRKDESDHGHLGRSWECTECGEAGRSCRTTELPDTCENCSSAVRILESAWSSGGFSIRKDASAIIK